MRIRRLEPWEHGKTRELYEKVFTEDDEAFIDYYYKWKTRDSRIYVAEEDGKVHAMVHLNPFQVWVKGSVQTLHYIVAVATRPEYRHRGLMRALLEMAEKEMAQAGERFTFLMPAFEQIYAPLGYRFFSRQRCGSLKGEAQTEHAEMTVRPVCREEYAALAAFVNAVLKKQYDVFVYRDEAYYERLCAEQECQNGQVMVICRRNPDETLCGTFCTSKEDGKAPELREVILAPEHTGAARDAVLQYLEEAKDAVFGYAAQTKGVRVTGCQRELLLEEACEKPFLMAKVPCGGTFCSEWEADRVFINEVV